MGLSASILPSLQSRANNIPEEKVTEVKPGREFSAPFLTAEAAIVYDIDHKKVLFEKKSNDQLPLASVTKLMTALVVSEHLEPNESVTISDQDLAGGSNAGLIVGDTWTTQNLLDYTLVTSANGGASALARTVSLKTGQEFVVLMNKKAEELRLDNTYFINETGLDIGNTYGGSYGSAYDMAILLSHIIKTEPRLISATSQNTISTTSNSGRVYNGANTNYIVNNLPGLIGSKTGFTYQAGGNLAVAIDAGLNQPVAIVVLGSTRASRFGDVDRLASSTINYFTQ